MTSFYPMEPRILESSLNLFSKVNVFLLPLIAALATMRIALLLTQVAAASRYIDVFEDVAKYFAATLLFPRIVQIILDFIFALAEKLSFPQNNSLSLRGNEFAQLMAKTSEWFDFHITGADVTICLISQSVYTLALSLFIVIAPVLFILGVFFGMNGRIGQYFSTFIALALWPVLWNLLGLLALEITKNSNLSAMASFIFATVMFGVQILSPLISAFLFSTMNPLAALGKIASIGRSGL